MAHHILVEDDQMSDELDASTTTEVCRITSSLIKDISGGMDSRKISTLDLHLRNSYLGKIRKIEGLQSLTNLKVLNLSYNAITVIEGLDHLHLLVELNLAENSIRRLENMGNLGQLQRLNIAGNQISRIPESISCLKSLKMLRYARNDLSEIKDISYLGDLHNLTNVSLEDNPVMMLEQCVPYAIYCIQTLVMMNNVKITPSMRESAIKRFTTVESEQRHELFSNELRSQQPDGGSDMRQYRAENRSQAMKRVESKYPVVVPTHSQSQAMPTPTNTSSYLQQQSQAMPTNTSSYLQQQSYFDSRHNLNRNTIVNSDLIGADDSGESDIGQDVYVTTDRFNPQSPDRIRGSTGLRSDARHSPPRNHNSNVNINGGYFDQPHSPNFTGGSNRLVENPSQTPLAQTTGPSGGGASRYVLLLTRMY